MPSPTPAEAAPAVYFTVAEANAALAELRARLSRIMQLRTRLKGLHAEFVSSGVTPTLDLARGVDTSQAAVATPRHFRDAAMFHAMVESLNDELEAIQDGGCQVKDIEVGLVDWPARFAGRDVLLCWKLGEQEVGHWHELDTGFAGRRSVAELVE